MQAPEQPPIPQDLRRFVVTGIPSVPFLEALLLLRGEAERAWPSDDIARRLYVRPRDAAALRTPLTGWGGEDDRERTSAAGFDLHLSKLVDLAAIEKMLSSV